MQAAWRLCRNSVTIAQIGHVRKHEDPSSRAWLYGKLFVALLSQKLCLLYSVSSAQWWNYSFPHSPTRHGEIVFQIINSFVAHSVDLSVWQEVQGLGILYLFVIVGEMNLKVCELTKLPGTPWVSIFCMWQATHWLPGLPSLWWVCSSRLAVWGPFGDVGP